MSPGLGSKQSVEDRFKKSSSCTDWIGDGYLTKQILLRGCTLVGDDFAPDKSTTTTMTISWCSRTGRDLI